MVEQPTTEQNYRPAYLDHFEKLEENQRNMQVGNKKQDNALKPGEALQMAKFLGPIDFDFVSNNLRIFA